MTLSFRAMNTGILIGFWKGTRFYPLADLRQKPASPFAEIFIQKAEKTALHSF